jgi:RNA polymerase sigma-70 factor (ECF subfamily)
LFFVFILERLFGRATPPALSRAELDALADEDLMLRYAAGDAVAFELLVRRHRDSVFHFVLRSVQQRERAEDLTQDVFMRVIRSAQRYERTAKFRTWLFTLARNICVDESRRARHRNMASLDASVSDDEPGATFVDMVADPSPRGGAGQLSRDQFMERLEQGLAALPDEQREVFVMRHSEGLRFPEIARIVGTSENTVKSRMRYALATLRRYVAEFEEHSFDDDEDNEIGAAAARRR